MTRVTCQRGTSLTGVASTPCVTADPSGSQPSILYEDLVGDWTSAVERESGGSHWVVWSAGSPSGGDSEWYTRRAALETRRHAERARKRMALVLLQSWIAEGDEDEDTENRAWLLRGLNEEREGQRQFPE